MGWNDHLREGFNYIYECPFCHKTFQVYEEEQIPGFRMKDYLYCPYCGKEITSSMEVEYHVQNKKTQF